MIRLLSHRILLTTLAAIALCSCASTFAPRYEQPVPPIPAQWPADTASGSPALTRQDSITGDSIQAVFADPQLQQTIQTALDNNRDLRIAALNIEKARAQYRIRRSELMPSVDIGLADSSGRTPASVSGTGAAVTSHVYSATLGISAWELDLFGRLRNLKDQALQQYFATEEIQHAARLGLISEVAGTYLSWEAASEQLAVARETLRSRQEAYDLQRQLRDVGNAPDLSVRQAEAELEAARDQALALESDVATIRNALQLLVGTQLPADLRPTVPLESMLAVQDLPAGLPSDLLHRRPDILAAEHALRAANANIGAARAAFFPNISLTGGIGRASDSLSDLFDGSNRAWSFAPQISVPVFNAGRLRASLDVAKVERTIAVADYERSIQSAFREVADTLVIRDSLDGRLLAQQRQVEAAQDAYVLVQRRYDNGVSPYLEVLDAQRTLYAARQGWIATRLARQTNLVTMYKALGGGW
jgi:multidrug efflux system outer membrane protein